MRGTWEQGRFNLPYERKTIASGIDYDLQRQVGQEIAWWRFDREATTVDEIYDVGASSGGRRYKDPLIILTLSAVIMQGQVRENDRGYYNTDTLRATVNITELDTKLRDSLSGSLNEYLLDRIVYRNEVFVPTRVYPRGLLGDSYTVFTIDADQVNAEQLVNDPQFQNFAL
jgi:hypothetical protein